MNDKVEEPVVSYDKLYTYADYLRWEIEERIELIKGKIFKMAPAPASNHQLVQGELFGLYYNFLKNKSCRLFSAPFDVRLIDPKKKSKKDEDIITVVQPDICIVCDIDKIDQRGCLGAPDLVVEILSPGNSKKELKNKFELYEENGIKEYWLIDYIAKTILIYTLKDGKYIGLKPLIEEETIHSPLFPEMSFLVGEIFQSTI